METVTSVVGSSVDVEAFPRIDRYFPQCKIAALEANARYLFGVDDFGKIYGRHSFQYQKPEGPIGFRPNGVELDVYIHRVELGELELESLIEDIFGIRTTLVRFRDLEEYRRFCLDSIRRGRPVASDFDLKFISARREYGKVENPHVVVLRGYDPRTRELLAAEQMLGTISIAPRDLEECFAHKLATFGEMHVWELSRVRENVRGLDREEVVQRCRSNLENLTSSDERLGLCGLACFQDDLTRYLAGESFRGKPFSVPGLWVFSHERHIERKWLQAVAETCAPLDRDFLQAFDDVLSKLFNRWLGIDYLLEKCLASGSGRALKGIPKHLAEIVAEEKVATQMWLRLEALIARA